MVQQGSKTEKELIAAFAGESQARNRYTMYAEVARDEGLMQIANFFLETAHNEMWHAKSYFGFLPGGMADVEASYPTDIGDTKENLKFAAAGEHEEHTVLYPNGAKVAEEEGYPEVAKLFNDVAKVEAEHERRYLKLLDNMEQGIVFKRGEKVYWKCMECGAIFEANEAPMRCPTCGNPQAYFELFAENY